MDLCFPSGIFPSKKTTNIFRGGGKQGLIARQRSQKGGELLLQGVFLFGVSGGQSNALQLVETAIYDRNIRGNRKRLGNGKGRSLESAHLAKSEILIIRIFTLWTLDSRNKNAGNWGKALQKKEREKINKCLRENYGQKTTDEMKTSNNLLTKTEGPILEIPTIRNV